MEAEGTIDSFRQGILLSLERLEKIVCDRDKLSLSLPFEKEVCSLKRTWESIQLGWAPDAVQAPNLPARVMINVEQFDMKSGIMIPPALNVTLNNTTLLLSLRNELFVYLTKGKKTSATASSLKMTLKDRILSQAKHDNLTVSQLRIQVGSVIKVWVMDPTYVEPMTALETAFLPRDPSVERRIATVMFACCDMKQIPLATTVLDILQSLPSTDVHRTTLQDAIMDVSREHNFVPIRRYFPLVSVESKTCSNGRGTFALDLVLPKGFGRLSTSVLRWVLSYWHWRDLAAFHAVCRATASPERLGSPWITILTIQDPEMLRGMSPYERCEGDSAFRWMMRIRTAQEKGWNCTACTFVNEKKSTRCKMCDKPSKC